MNFTLGPTKKGGRKIWAEKYLQIYKYLQTYLENRPLKLSLKDWRSFKVEIKITSIWIPKRNQEGLRKKIFSAIVGKKEYSFVKGSSLRLHYCPVKCLGTIVVMGVRCSQNDLFPCPQCGLSEEKRDWFQEGQKLKRVFRLNQRFVLVTGNLANPPKTNDQGQCFKIYAVIFPQKLVGQPK